MFGSFRSEITLKRMVRTLCVGFHRSEGSSPLRGSWPGMNYGYAHLTSVITGERRHPRCHFLRFFAEEETGREGAKGRQQEDDPRCRVNRLPPIVHSQGEWLWEPDTPAAIFWDFLQRKRRLEKERRDGNELLYWQRWHMQLWRKKSCALHRSSLRPN